MKIEEKISRFMMTFSKFEFFLINQNIELAHIIEGKNTGTGCLQRLTGVDWNKLAVLLEGKYTFLDFNFKEKGILLFKETAPQYLVKASETGKPKWDSDEGVIDSWNKLLTRSFAQFRNNIAHGNKGQLLAPFTQGRTEQFIEAGYALINFIAVDIFKEASWEAPIAFS